MPPVQRRCTSNTVSPWLPAPPRRPLENPFSLATPGTSTPIAVRKAPQHSSKAEVAELADAADSKGDPNRRTAGKQRVSRSGIGQFRTGSDVAGLIRGSSDRRREGPS